MNDKIVYVLVMALICLLTINGILYGQINEKNLIIEKQSEIHNNKISEIENKLTNIGYVLDKKQDEYNEYYKINKEYSDLSAESFEYMNKSNVYTRLFNEIVAKDGYYVETERTKTGAYRDFLKNEYNPFIKEYNKFTEEYNLYLDTYDKKYATINDKENDHIEMWFNYWNIIESNTFKLETDVEF